MMQALRRIVSGSLISACVLCGQGVVADVTQPRTDNIPSALVTANTKQVYRFHFSGLLGTDATRLAQQLWPVVSKLPADNPLHRTFLDAKDKAGFADDYRSLRNIFLEFGIDTIYFLADEYWIEATTLPGTVVMVGDTAVRDRLQQRLQAAGHDDWAGTIGQFRTSPLAPGWMTFSIDAATGGQTSTAKKKIVEHALKESCPIKPASFHLGSLPALRMALNDATPLTVVNLERNKLDAVLTQMLTTLVPSSAQTAKLSERVTATTVTASVNPFPYVRQVAHFSSAGEATAFAAEVNKQVKGAVQKVVDLDEEIGPLMGLFAQSTIIVSTQGNDVHMVMKPPVLFDLNLAAIKATSAMDQDWTALPAPRGYNWELIGSVGSSSRNDVFARVHKVRVRGTSGVIAAVGKAAEPASFRLPDFGLILTRDLQGNLQVETTKKGTKGSLPALELLDDRDRAIATLRLDLGPGDPRFDLARTRSVLAKRITEQTKAVREAKKEVDEVENAHQRAKLSGSARTTRQSLEEWDEKLWEKYRAHGMAQAAIQVLQELDNQARETQREHPGVTLVKVDGAAGSPTTWSIDRSKFPFAGQWVFDYGVLTLHQDASGNVAGVFATKVFYNSAKQEIDQGKGTVGSAILTGEAKGSKLDFTMFDFRGRVRTGQLVLDADGTGGSWKLESTTTQTTRSSKTNRVLKGSPRKVEKEAEDDRRGSLDRVEVAAPMALCVQQVPTASFAGYWVHPTDKRMNILFKAPGDDGLLEGAMGNSQTTAGNLRAAASGNLLVILENVHGVLQSPSVREATLSADGQRLTFLAPREKSSTSGLVGRNSMPLELTKDRSP